MLLSLAALAFVQQAVAQTDMTTLVIEEKLEALNAKECPEAAEKAAAAARKAKDGSGKKTKDGSGKKTKDGSGKKTADGSGKKPKKTPTMLKKRDGTKPAEGEKP
jgi:hypothetical protein